MTRSLSVPDSASVWEMQNSSSQASCTPNLQQAAPCSELHSGSLLRERLALMVELQPHVLCSAAWDGGSVWDLPIDSMAQAPTIEQMQQYEKAKTAKVVVQPRPMPGQNA